MTPSGSRTCDLAVAVAAFVAAAVPVLAAPPVLDSLMPSGGQVGAEIAELVTSGKADPWPASIWCSNPGVTFLPLEKANQYRVTVAQDATVGPCLVRVFNGEGASEPRIFVVSQLREMTEDPKADNDKPAAGTPLGDLPVVVNGKLEKSQDIDAWKVSLKKGQVLHARVDGYSLRSGLDPFLHLYDPDGVRIELASDNPRNLDPRIVHSAARDGDYTLAVMAIDSPPNANVSFTGSAKAVYRLTVSLGPLDASVAGAGDGAPAGPDNLPANGGKPLELPVQGFGTLAKPGESDRIVFQAKKGMNLKLLVDAVSHGFPTDPVMVLEKDDGSTIREVDDDKTDRDATYVYKIPADGEYACRISDRYRRGGEEIRYAFSVAEVVPDFLVKADQGAYLSKDSAAVTIKLAIERIDGHEQALEGSVSGLPPGLTAAPFKIAAKAKDGTVELKVDPAAATAFSGPIQVALTETEGESKQSRTAVFGFQTGDSRGPYLIDELAELWLTIQPKAVKSDEKAEK